jgi:hypothetical protein
MKTTISVRIAAAVLATLFVAGAQPNNQTAPTGAPEMLDLSRFYRQWFITPSMTNKEFAALVGQQMYDGLPFHIEGRGYVYGRKQARSKGRPANAFPDFVGIGVGRTFDELHLLHGSRWADVEGETIAFIRLNYADGSKHEFPIRYGVHVRDWLRLRSEEKELLTDPNTKVIFRGQPGACDYKSTMRMFKTTLANPNPGKIVATLDVVSTQRLASYDLVAVTVAQRDSDRPTTPPCPLNEPDRHFDGAVMIRVLDQATGRPIQGALIDPGMNVDDTGVIAAPLYTTTNGTTVIRYPLGRADHIYVSVEKAGFEADGAGWDRKNIPDAFTFWLKPEGSAANSLPKSQ